MVLRDARPSSVQLRDEDALTDHGLKELRRLARARWAEYGVTITHADYASTVFPLTARVVLLRREDGRHLFDAERVELLCGEVVPSDAGRRRSASASHWQGATTLGLLFGKRAHPDAFDKHAFQNQYALNGPTTTGRPCRCRSPMRDGPSRS